MPAAARAAAGRWIVAVALLLFALLVLRNGAAMARYAAVALGYPYDLDYGEGIVWQQARDIAAGRGYAPLGVFPAIVFHYPPVYHLTSLALAGLTGLDELVAGRAVSIAATVATMLLCARLAAMLPPAGTRRGVRLAVGAAAPAIFISFTPVAMWFAFMRVDMLAGALSLGGLLLAVEAVRRPALVLPAALLFVLSIYTKQTSIAAPAAAFLMLALLRPRLAAVLALACVALGLAALAALTFAGDGGFLRHILGYNLNRYDWTHLPLMGEILRRHAIFFAAATIGVAMALRRLRADWRGLCAEPGGAAMMACLAFLAIKTAMLPMILKTGSSYNYLIEWLSAVAIFAAAGLAPLAAAALGKVGTVPLPLVVAALLLPAQVLKAPGWDLTAGTAARRAASLAPLVARIRAADRPVVSDQMVLLIRAGQPVRWEPAIAAELGHSGQYDEAAFARLIRARAFAFFVTTAELGAPLYDDRYNPIVADAMAAAYPRRECVAGLILHSPPR